MKEVNIMNVFLDAPELSYTGRVDMRNPKKPEFVFPATSLQFRFHGKAAVLTVSNRCAYWQNSVGAIIDGQQKCFPLNDTGETVLRLLDEAEDADHEIMIFKRMDSCHEMVLEALELSRGSVLLPPPEKPNRRIEVYGDSVSAGEVSEAVDYVGKEDPVHDGGYSKEAGGRHADYC